MRPTGFASERVIESGGKSLSACSARTTGGRGARDGVLDAAVCAGRGVAAVCWTRLTAERCALLATTYIQYGYTTEQELI
mgnify:CR=1 FL=1|jgi:hypothetical protein